MTSGSGAESHPEHPPHSPILTHLVEGFVIQEGNTPFPLERPSFSVDALPLKELRLQERMLTCEFCGKVDVSSAFRRSKRFCSTACTKRYSLGYSRRAQLFTNSETMKKRMVTGPHRGAGGAGGAGGGGGAGGAGAGVQDPRRKKLLQGSCPSPQPAQGETTQCADLPYPSPPRRTLSPDPDHDPDPDPGRWDVNQVYHFICSLPGCLDIAEEFRSQEIDGQALLLLNEDHLLGTMNIKLGPALKLYAHIRLLRDQD